MDGNLAVSLEPCSSISAANDLKTSTSFLETLDLPTADTSLFKRVVQNRKPYLFLEISMASAQFTRSELTLNICPD